MVGVVVGVAVVGVVGAEGVEGREVGGDVAGVVVDGAGAGGDATVVGLVDGGGGDEPVEPGERPLPAEIVVSLDEGCWPAVVVDGVAGADSVVVGVDGAGTVVSPGSGSARLRAPMSVAEGGSTICSSTTETPAHATPTAAALAASHIANSRIFLTDAVFPIASPHRVKATLNGS